MQLCVSCHFRCHDFKSLSLSLLLPLLVLEAGCRYGGHYPLDESYSYSQCQFKMCIPWKLAFLVTCWNKCNYCQHQNITKVHIDQQNWISSQWLMYLSPLPWQVTGDVFCKSNFSIPEKKCIEGNRHYSMLTFIWMIKSTIRFTKFVSMRPTHILWYHASGSRVTHSESFEKTWVSHLISQNSTQNLNELLGL